MKKYYLSIFLGLSILVVFGCRKQTAVIDKRDLKQGRKIKAIDSNFISIEEAVQIALNHKKGRISASIESSPRRAASSKLLDYYIYTDNIHYPDQNIKLRRMGAENDQKEPILYVLNYDNNTSTIVPADHRYGGIIATLDSTTISPGMPAPEGFIMYMQTVSAYIKDIKEENIIPKSDNFKDLDSLIQFSAQLQKPSIASARFKQDADWKNECLNDDPFSKPTTCNTGFEHYYINEQPKCTVKWGQEKGFNHLLTLNCKDNGRNGGKTYTGCVATAMGQLMSIYKWPKSYDWNNMQIGGLQVGALMYNLGAAVNTKYSCRSSSAVIEKIQGAFKKFEYYSKNIYVGDLCKLKVSALYNNKDFKPVIIGACKVKKVTGWWIFTSTRFSKCHAWLMDGFTCRRYCSNESVPNTKYQFKVKTEVLYHHNFGWYGVYNGWYNSNLGSNGGINENTNYKYEVKLISASPKNIR